MESHVPGAAPGGSGARMGPGKRRVSFEAVTIRTAARLVRQRRQRLLTAAELERFLDDLLGLDQLTTCFDAQVLRRLARRYVARAGARQSPTPLAGAVEPPARRAATRTAADR